MQFRPAFLALQLLALALFASGCGTPGAPVPSRSVKVGPKPASAKPDLLPQWTDKTEAKRQLLAFVERSVARESGAFVPVEDRVAVLSSAFLAAGVGEREVRALRELTSYLEANAYRVYLVSEGDAEPLRAAARERLGLAPERVIGAFPAADYVVRDGRPSVVTRPGAARAEKPVVIYRAIGGRPVLALGAEAADATMLEYTTLANPRPSAAFVVAGEASPLRAEAAKRGWFVLSPGADWAGDAKR